MNPQTQEVQKTQSPRLPRPSLITPRTRFQLSATRVSALRALIEQDVFRQATDAALLEMQTQIQFMQDMNPNAALAGYYRLMGAQELIGTFIQLAELAQPISKAPAQSLNHNV